jgi:hypothetical protein
MQMQSTHRNQSIKQGRKHTYAAAVKVAPQDQLAHFHIEEASNQFMEGMD